MSALIDRFDPPMSDGSRGSGLRKLHEPRWLPENDLLVRQPKGDLLHGTWPLGGHRKGNWVADCIDFLSGCDDPNLKAGERWIETMT